MRGKANFLAAGAVCLACVFATPARADDAPTKPAPAEHAVWYGGPTVAIDLLSMTLPFVALASAGGSSDGSGPAALLVLSALGYVLGGPIVHAVNHADGGLVAADLVLRLGAPILTAAMGVELGKSSQAACDAQDDGTCFETLGTGVLGLYVGMIAVSIVDIAALSWTTVEDGPAGTPTPSAWHSLALTPVFATHRELGRDAPTFGVAGRF
jgi:hypothetical protein